MPSSSSPTWPPVPPEEDNNCPSGGDSDCPCPPCDDDSTPDDDCPPDDNSDDNSDDSGGGYGEGGGSGGAGGGSSSNNSQYPVRYSSGQIQLSETDLSAKSFGLLWGHTRSYANILSNNGGGFNGNSWLVPQLKALAFINASFGQNDPDKICVVEGGSTSRWFKKQGDGTYRPLFSGYDVLVHDPSTLEFVLTNKRGKQIVFYDNSSNQPHALVGMLKAIIDKSGRTITATYDSNGQFIKLEQEVDGQISGFYYDYFSTGNLTGRLATVTVKVRGAPVRQASYGYYDGEAGGSSGDLKSVVIEQYDSGSNAWKPIVQKHYRYYSQGDAHGFAHGLKYVIRGAAYQSMVDAGLNPETAPESILAGYANFYFEYDGANRVSLERVEGGRKQFGFEYDANPTTDTGDVNVWRMKTVESLPDGNENRVYTNNGGQVILKIFMQTATGNQWYVYAQFDSLYHVVLQANSFAVASVTEPSSGDSTLVVNLKSADGLIRGYVFYTTTDPTTGAVEGYLEQETVSQGTAGSAIIVRKVEYDTQQAFGQTIYPLSAELLYPLGDNNDANASRTSYSYTWYPDGSNNPTFQLQEKVTTYPIVSSSQNGSDVAGVETREFDIFGQVTWIKNQRGAITYMAYDAVTSTMVQRIDDVDTSRMSDVPTGWQTVSGWGLHLVTDYINDGLGRAVQTRGPWNDVQLCECDTTTTPVRRVEFTAFLDETLETRRASGYMTGEDPTADFQTVGATRISRMDESGNIIDEIQSTRVCNGGALNSGEKFSQERWTRWTLYIFDTWGRLDSMRVYHRIPTQGEGGEGANYLETIYGYDDMGRRNRIIEPSGTIRRRVYDARGLVISNWTGTDDHSATDTDPTGGGAPGNNMVCVSEQQYDGSSAGGDGNLTQVTQHVDSSSGNDRIVNYGFDYRDRRNSVTQTDGTTTWNTATSYNNLDKPLQNTTSVVGGNMIAQSRTLYDALGRVYRHETDGVDPTGGSIVNTLISQNWYDLGGNIIKASQAGTTSFTKTVFDALNRPTATYVGCVPGESGVPTGDDNNVSTDTILEQNETSYDRGGNAILAVKRQRFDDATGTGPLQDVNNQPEARVSYAAYWPDGIGRVQVAADFGTNGGAALTRPAVAPARSDTALVTTNQFKDNGEANAVIDPMGLETRWENDQAGRRVKLIENFNDRCPEKMRISEYCWHASGQLLRLTLLNSVTGNQLTNWVYGTTLYDSAVADANLLRAKIYPESDDRPAPLDAGPDGIYARLEYTYNRQGQAITFTDADGTVHSYGYDKLGRLLSDAVTNLGSDLNNAVLRIERQYEARGMLTMVTSYNAASGGDIVNQSAFTYDAFANLASDQQSHSGAVGSSTPEVLYNYADGSANTVRRTATMYPDGKILNVQYGSGDSVDDHFSRVTALQFDGESTPLVEYTYIGVAWQVRVGYPGPAVELTYKKQGSEPAGDAGDPYNGYDRFGRTQDIRWQTVGS